MRIQAYDNARRLRNATAGFKLYNKRQALVPLERVPTPAELRSTAVTGTNAGVTAVAAGASAIIRRLDEALGVHYDDNPEYYHAASTDSDIDGAPDTACDRDELTAIEVDMLFSIMENGNDTAGTDDNSNDQMYQMFASAVRDQHTVIEFNQTQQYGAQRKHQSAVNYARQAAERLGHELQHDVEPVEYQPQQPQQQVHNRQQPQQQIQYQQQYRQPVQPNWYDPVMQQQQQQQQQQQRQQQFVGVAGTDYIVQRSSTHIHVDMSNCLISAGTNVSVFNGDLVITGGSGCLIGGCFIGGGSSVAAATAIAATLEQSALQHEQAALQHEHAALQHDRLGQYAAAAADSEQEQ
jgi:hypothetical protein